jgi:molecular chaperone GrpE
MTRPRPDDEAVREQLAEKAAPEPDEAERAVDAAVGPEPEEEPLAKAERERDEYLELSQRTRAELENYRKRAAREAAQAGERAKANLIRELLPVLDNLERAIESAGEGEQHLADGVKMVHAQLVAATREEGESGLVLNVVEKGYKLNGSVLRPARVVVSA